MKKTAVSVRIFGPPSLCSREFTVIERYSMKRPSRYCVGTSQDFLQDQVGGGGGMEVIRKKLYKSAKEIHKG